MLEIHRCGAGLGVIVHRPAKQRVAVAKADAQHKAHAIVQIFHRAVGDKAAGNRCLALIAAVQEGEGEGVVLPFMGDRRCAALIGDGRAAGECIIAHFAARQRGCRSVYIQQLHILGQHIAAVAQLVGVGIFAAAHKALAVIHGGSGPGVQGRGNGVGVAVFAQRAGAAIGGDAHHLAPHGRHRAVRRNTPCAAGAAGGGLGNGAADGFAPRLAERKGVVALVQAYQKSPHALRAAALDLGGILAHGAALNAQGQGRVTGAHQKAGVGGDIAGGIAHGQLLRNAQIAHGAAEAGQLAVIGLQQQVQHFCVGGILPQVGDAAKDHTVKALLLHQCRQGGAAAVTAKIHGLVVVQLIAAGGIALHAFAPCLALRAQQKPVLFGRVQKSGGALGKIGLFQHLPGCIGGQQKHAHALAAGGLDQLVQGVIMMKKPIGLGEALAHLILGVFLGAEQKVAVGGAGCPQNAVSAVALGFGECVLQKLRAVGIGRAL